MMILKKKLILNKENNNFFIDKKLFSLIFLIKLFYLFNECFLKDFKSYFILLYFVRFDFLLFNLFINNLQFFINNLQFYFYCLYYNFYNYLIFLYKFLQIKLLNFNFILLKNLDYKIIILNELSYKNLKYFFLYKLFNYFFFSISYFRLKFDYFGFIYMRSYFAYYRAFKYNDYLWSFFNLNNLFYLLKFFRFNYSPRKKIRKQFTLRLRRVYREALMYYRYLVFHLYFGNPNLIFVAHPLISNNFILFNGFIFFLILSLSLNILFLFFFHYFYFYIFPFIFYIIYLSVIRFDWDVYIYYYISRFVYHHTEEIFFELFYFYYMHMGFFYSFFLNYLRLYFLQDIFCNSLINNYLIINIFLDYKKSISIFFLNLNRFFYRMNYLFLLNYASDFFFEHFWDLDLLDIPEAFKWVSDWCVYFILRFTYIVDYFYLHNFLSYSLNLKSIVDFVFWNIFNIDNYYSFQNFFIDLKYIIKKLDIDNLISYDTYRLGAFIDIIFNNLVNELIDFSFIVKSYFTYFFFRDFFFKFFIFFKLFIFIQNKLIYSFILIYWRLYNYNIFILNFYKINCLEILFNFHLNFLFDYQSFIF